MQKRRLRAFCNRVHECVDWEGLCYIQRIDYLFALNES